MKLNLGSGKNLLEGFVNVDKYSTFSPDVVHDLEKFPWPFLDNSVSEIVMNHSLEHLGENSDCFLAIISEIYRVAANGCILRINVPHPRSMGFESDPTHVRPVTPNIMNLFSKKKNREYTEKGWPNTQLAMYLNVDIEEVNITYILTPHWAEMLNSGADQKDIYFAIETYYNVVDEIVMEYVVNK